MRASCWFLCLEKSAITFGERCKCNQTIIGSDNGLLPGRHQALIWTNTGILLIWPLRTNFSEILIEIQMFSFRKMHLKTSSAKWQPILSHPQCVKSCDAYVDMCPNLWSRTTFKYVLIQITKILSTLLWKLTRQSWTSFTHALWIMIWEDNHIYIHTVKPLI